jgi:uncharacterized protein RhaS with RHS repeats
MDYNYNNLNQLTSKTDSRTTTTEYSYDKRGNRNKGTQHSEVVEAYEYDATNRMVKGMNEYGETSAYNDNGRGYLVGQSLNIMQGFYGYNQHYYPKATTPGKASTGYK